MNPFISPDRVEDHLVWVHRIHTAGGQTLQYLNSTCSYSVRIYSADTNLPINDKVPPGLGQPVAVERGPTAVQFKRHVHELGSFQLHLEIHRLLQVLGDRISRSRVKPGVGVI